MLDIDEKVPENVESEMVSDLDDEPGTWTTRSAATISAHNESKHYGWLQTVNTYKKCKATTKQLTSMV